MLNQTRAESRHSDILLAGFRAHAAAIGLVHLLKELQAHGILPVASITRIKDAIIDELMLSRPIHADETDFRNRLHSRFDRLLDDAPNNG